MHLGGSVHCFPRMEQRIFPSLGRMFRHRTNATIQGGQRLINTAPLAMFHTHEHHEEHAALYLWLKFTETTFRIRVT